MIANKYDALTWYHFFPSHLTRRRVVSHRKGNKKHWKKKENEMKTHF